MTLCNAKPHSRPFKWLSSVLQRLSSISSEAKVPKQCLACAPNAKSISANRFGHISLEGDAIYAPNFSESSMRILMSSH